MDRMTLAEGIAILLGDIQVGDFHVGR